MMPTQRPPQRARAAARLLSLALFVALPAHAAPPDPQAVVATVGAGAGAVEITAGRLLAYARQRPERPLEAALQDLIDFELLAAKAQKLALPADDTRQLQVHQAMVRSYLHHDFEPTVRDDRLPMADVERAYELNRSFFVHPPLRHAVHLLVSGPDAKRPADAALDAQAQTLAQRLRQELIAANPPDHEAFLEAGRALIQAHKAAQKEETPTLALRAEDLSYFAAQGNFDQTFTQAAFSQKRHEVGEPVATPFGWHIIWVEEILDAKNEPLSKVEAEVRARIGPEVRVREWMTLTNRLAVQYEAAMDPEPLQALEHAPTAAEDPALSAPPPGAPPAPSTWR